MPFQQDTFMGSDGETLITYFKMIPEGTAQGVVQIVHGMCEYMERYTDLAEYLCDKGYVVCGEDHMGTQTENHRKSKLPSLSKVPAKFKHKANVQ